MTFVTNLIYSNHTSLRTSNDKLVGIITEKDIFMQIARNLTMVTDFAGQKYPVQYREVYERFTEYMFDLLPKL